jgi:hypothetical protein
MSTRLDRLADRYREQMERDRVAVAAEVRNEIASFAERQVDEPDCCHDAWTAFAQWVRALPTEDKRFTVLAASGLSVAGRGWGATIRVYIDGYVGNDSFGLTVPNLFPFCERPGNPSQFFDEFFDLLLLDALASAMYDASPRRAAKSARSGARCWT